MHALKNGVDALFILLGVIMILAMHAKFAFLALGTVRKKSQVNALIKILVDFAISPIARFFVGYTVTYDVNFFSDARTLTTRNGFELVNDLWCAQAYRWPPARPVVSAEGPLHSQ